MQIRFWTIVFNVVYNYSLLCIASSQETRKSSFGLWLQKREGCQRFVFNFHYFLSLLLYIILTYVTFFYYYCHIKYLIYTLTHLKYFDWDKYILFKRYRLINNYRKALLVKLSLILSIHFLCFILLLFTSLKGLSWAFHINICYCY